ncbi:MAG: magnesium transporter [Oscillospiraceae bacterium]|mgnify:FL=1|nr:magnesium transporter [Oscillospiraceae bacterium]MBR6696030.1 magnesium transporter [Oscillospiraceae bacterium]
MGDNYRGFSVTIEKLLEEKKYASLRDILTTINPADIALIFAEIQEEKLPLLFRLLPKELAAEAFVEMDEDMQEHLIRGFSDAELKAVVDELYVDDAVDIVEEMPANVVKRVLKQADPELRKMINEILKYPEDSAGSIMTTEYLSLRPQMTVEEAIKRIRRTCVDKETIYTCYVTDQNRTLIGMLSLKDLLVADDDDIVENIMETNVICVETHTDQEEVAQSLSKYNFMALPVVDKETRLVGIVTFDDAIDVIEEETTEDIEMMAAITPTDKPYLKTSVFEIWKKRIPWLLLLMISATFTTLIISSFESALAAQLVLTSFIPMIMGTGGNSGSQSSVTIIRGLSLDEIEFSDILRVIWKETRVAILCGLTLAVANFFKLILFEGVEVAISLTISLTLLITVLVAKVIGSSLPMLAKKIGFDPAVMASPLITTMVDALSLLVYFTTATALLNL